MSTVPDMHFLQILLKSMTRVAEVCHKAPLLAFTNFRPGYLFVCLGPNWHSEQAAQVDANHVALKAVYAPDMECPCP